MSADDELAAMFLAVGATNFTPGATARRWPTAALPEIVELLVIAIGQRRQGAALAAIVRGRPDAHCGRNGKIRVDEVDAPCRVMRHRCRMQSETPRTSGSRCRMVAGWPRASGCPTTNPGCRFRRSSSTSPIV